MGTSSPAPRRTRANATAARSSSGTARRHSSNDFIETVSAETLLVLAILEDSPEGRLDRAFVQHGDTESRQGLGPVDALGYARRLIQLERAHGLDGGGDLTSERV